MATINIPNIGNFIIRDLRHVIPSNESELAKMTLGEFAKVTHKKPFRNLEIYEGKIEGKYAFMLQSSQDHTKINSFRISNKDIKFDNYYGAILEEKHTKMVQYSPGDKDYEIKKQMLIKAEQWKNISN